MISKIMSNPYMFDLVQYVIEGNYANYIHKYLPLDDSYSVIDIGCGTGEFCCGVKGQYVGIDINAKFLNYGRKKYGSTNPLFVEMDAMRISYPINSFDYAMIINVMHHFNDSDFLLILNEVKSITKNFILVADMIPPKTNLISKFLYNLDQGNYIRPLEYQKGLISEVLDISSYEVFVSPRKIYTHSIIIGDVNKK